MNQRIKKIALECYNPYGNFDIEKFAELIVRQCAMKANAVAIDLRNYSDLDARKYVGDSILKVFGVEEE